MANTSRRRMAELVAIVAATSLVAACNVFTDQETEAQQRFEAVAIGTHEGQLIASLGMPQGNVTRSGQNQFTFEFDELSDRGKTLIDEANRSKWPKELRFLPKRRVSNKVLIYLDGTVWAFYYISSRGDVEYASVFIS